MSTPTWHRSLIAPSLFNWIESKCSSDAASLTSFQLSVLLETEAIPLRPPPILHWWITGINFLFALRSMLHCSLASLHHFSSGVWNKKSSHELLARQCSFSCRTQPDSLNVIYKFLTSVSSANHPHPRQICLPSASLICHKLKISRIFNKKLECQMKN